MIIKQFDRRRCPLGADSDKVGSHTKCEKELNMQKKNIFSGKYEPDKNTCTEANESNVARFRTAMLKLDRIHNDDNEKDLTENIMQLCSRNNKTGEKIELSGGCHGLAGKSL